jgi:hypothetical protein
MKSVIGKDQYDGWKKRVWRQSNQQGAVTQVQADGDMK